MVSLEDLSIEAKDHKKGKIFNKVVNNKWNRNDMIHYITKRAKFLGMKVRTINPKYSSFVGNLNNPEFFDPVASSIELGRRVIPNQEWYPVIPDREKLRKQLPEVTGTYRDWKELWGLVKVIPHLRYRNSLSKDSSFKTFHHYRSDVLIHNGWI